MSLRRLTRPQLVLLGLVATGAALRFATLETQSFWIDEGYTVHLLRGSLSGLVHGIPRTEETPPLYYALGWLWTRPFGTAEAGVRSLSALFGTATIPVAYLLGRRLASQRAGLVAAALTAFNPLLVWYSQEARAYSLLVLLSGVSILLFLRALDSGSRRALVQWAVVSALALATHYFAIFVVAPEAAWLLLRVRRRRAAALAVAGVGAVGGALLALAIHQSHNEGARFIHGTAIGSRIGQVPKQFLVGYASPSQVVFTVAAGALAVTALVFAFTRTGPSARRGTAVATAFVGFAVGVPLIVATAGADFFITRNVIAGWLPFAVVLAAGLGAQRARLLGPALAAVLCGLSLAAVIEVDARPEFQRDDWRAAARALGPPRVARALVVSPLNGLVPLSLYAPHLHRFPAHELARVSEVDVLGVAVRRPGETPRPPRGPAIVPYDFRQVLRIDHPTFTLARMAAPRPRLISLRRLLGLRFDPHAADVLVQTPR